MRKLLILVVMSGFIATSFGCSSTMVTSPMTNESAGLVMDGSRILNRPVEYGLKEGKKVEAKVKSATFLGFIPVEGKNVKLNAPVVGLLSGKSKAQASACKQIFDQNPDADGLIVTQAFVEKGGVPGLYSYEIATIKGRTVSLVNLGMLSDEEAVAFRAGKSKIRSMMGAIQKPNGFVASSN